MSSLRLYQIIKTFLQFGLDELIPKHMLPWYAKLLRLSLFWLRNKHKDKPLALRFRLAIESLGPVFVKFGQMLSTRRDLLPDDFANELALLQDQVPAFEGERARKIIIEAIGEEVFNQHFIDFDVQPLASASIAQVHTATLLQDGQSHEVVLKVLRPNITDTIIADVNVMSLFAGVVSKFLPDGKRLRPKEVVNEYRKTIIDELDLIREAANATLLKQNFEQGDASDKVLYVPEVYNEYSHKNLMVMERIYGIGEEAGGGNLAEDAIWSHRFFVFDANNQPMAIPGSTIKAYGYTINPIDAATGVVVHEFGHDLGLPDEYDIDNSAIGSPVADWSVMSSGSWVGSPAGTRPSAFSPWARDYLQERYQGNWINQKEIDFASLTTETISLVSTVDHTAVNQIKVNLPAQQLDFHAAYAGDYQFYSNQGNMLKNSMSFSVNLPSGTSTLAMKARWEIEQDYDYLQVLVDNTPITGNHTKTNNQYYKNLGAHLSGKSANISGAEGDLKWTDLTFDLSAYANQSVTIKINYVTDQAEGGYGFVADEIKITNGDSEVISIEGETENEATLAGFSRVSDKIDALPHSYYVQLRSHTGVDSKLVDSNFDAGVLLWYRNDNYSDNKVNNHAGELFIGVVDAEQSLKTTQSGNFKSSYYQVQDAAFNFFGSEKHSTFSDLNDYSSPKQPESGIILPKYGFNMSIDTQSEDSTTASVTLSHGDAAHVESQQNGLDVSLSISDESASDDTVFTWNMGDGTELTGKTISHQYSAISDYAVSVTYSVASDEKTINHDLTLGVALSGTMTTEIDASTVSFTSDITGGDGSLSYRWIFGDNSDVMATGNAKHTYEATGTYQVILQVRDEINQLFELKKEVTIDNMASLSASITNSITNLAVNFTSTVSGGDEQYTYAWNFGDNTTSAAQNPKHTYSQEGTYTVVLTVTDGASHTTEVTQSIKVTAVSITSPAKTKSSGGGGSIGFGLLFGLCLLRRIRQ